MPQMTAQTTEYTFSLGEIKRMICKELDIPEAAVTVTYEVKDVSGDRYGSYSSDYQVTSVKVKVDNTKIKK